MLNINLDLNNSSNWNLIFQESYQADSTTINGKQKYLPISKIEIADIISTSYINCEFTANYKQDTWDSAGFVSPVAKLTIPGINNNLSLGKIFVYLNKGNLITIPTGTNQTYSLDYYPPEWFRDVSIKIFEFIGTIDDDYINLLNIAIDDINKLL